MERIPTVGTSQTSGTPVRSRRGSHPQKQQPEYSLVPSPSTPIEKRTQGYKQRSVSAQAASFASTSFSSLPSLLSPTHSITPSSQERKPNSGKMSPMGTDMASLEATSRALLRRDMATTRALRENLRQLASSKQLEPMYSSFSSLNTLQAPIQSPQIVDNQQSRTSLPPKFDRPNSRDFQEQLAKFYERENPTKLDLVPTLVAQHVGLRQENRLKIRLLRKYGHVTQDSLALAWQWALPPPKVSRQSGLQTFCRCLFCCAADLPQRDVVADRKAFVSELIHFYEKFNPSKLTSSDSSLSKMVMSSKDADDLDLAAIKLKLLLKYSSFPTIGNAVERIQECTSALDLCLSKFYLRWNPAKSTDVAQLVRTFVGEREVELKFKLLSKYLLLPTSMDSDQVACNLMFDELQRLEWSFSS